VPLNLYAFEPLCLLTPVPFNPWAFEPLSL